MKDKKYTKLINKPLFLQPFKVFLDLSKRVKMKSKTSHVQAVEEGVDAGLKPPKLNKFYEMMDVYKGDKALVNFQTDQVRMAKAESIKKKFKMTFLQLIYNSQVIY